MKKRHQKFLVDFANYTRNFGIPPTLRDMIGMGDPPVSSTAVASHIVSECLDPYFVQTKKNSCRSWRINVPAIPRNLLYWWYADEWQITTLYVDEHCLPSFAGIVGIETVWDYVAPNDGIVTWHTHASLMEGMYRNRAEDAILTDNEDLMLFAVATKTLLYRPEWIIYEMKERGII